MSDYYKDDGRPGEPLSVATVDEELYVYHHGGLVGLEVGRFKPGAPTVTLGLTPDQARYVARELTERAEEVERAG